MGNMMVPAQIAMVAAKGRRYPSIVLGSIEAVHLDQVVVLVVYSSIGRVETCRGKTFGPIKKKNGESPGKETN